MVSEGALQPQNPERQCLQSFHFPMNIWTEPGKYVRAFRRRCPLRFLACYIYFFLLNLLQTRKRNGHDPRKRTGVPFRKDMITPRSRIFRSLRSEALQCSTHVPAVAGHVCGTEIEVCQNRPQPGG